MRPLERGALTTLLIAREAHFDWAIRGLESERFEGLRLAPGGLETPAVLAWIRRGAAASLAETGAPGAWLIVSGDEAVGLASFKGVPRDGVVEIGFGVAASRRRCGHASAAVALLVDEARRRGLCLTAETAPANRASARVLERNGFLRCGARVDPDEGALLSWRLDGDEPPRDGPP